jgi:tetratricopeptide (TPR) repeat protein
VLAAALRNLGYYRWWVGNYAEAAAALEEAMAAMRTLDHPLSPMILEILGLVEIAEGRTDEAVTHLEESVASLADSGDRRMVVQVQADLSHALRAAGRLDEAVAVLLDALATAADIEGEFEAAHCRTQLAIVRHCQGQPDAALAELALAVATALRLGDTFVLATCLQLGIVMAAEAGDHRRVAGLLGKLDALAATGGPVATPADREQGAALADQARAALGKAALNNEWTKGTRLTAADAARLAVGLP